MTAATAPTLAPPTEGDPMTSYDRTTGEELKPLGYQGDGLDFELTHVPERPGWLWDAYLGPTSVEHGWTRTKFGAHVAMWRCNRRWAKRARRG